MVSRGHWAIPSHKGWVLSQPCLFMKEMLLGTKDQRQEEAVRQSIQAECHSALHRVQSPSIVWPWPSGRTCTFLRLPNDTPSHCLMGGSQSQLPSLQLPLSSDTPQTRQYLIASPSAGRTPPSALLKSGMPPWLTLASDVSGGPMHHIEVGVFTGHCAVSPAPIPLPCQLRRSTF